MIRNQKSNKKAQIFMISIIIAITGALISSYILLKVMYEPKTDKEFLGSYQMGIVDALSDGDKAFIYIDQASKMAVNLALDEYINSNSPRTTEEVDSSGEGITADEIDSRKNCGNYVYRLWNNDMMNCYPGDYDSKDFELGLIINRNLIALNTIKTSMKEPIYIDKVLKQNIKYNYRYDAGFDSTKIYGFTTDTYTIGIFRDDETKKSTDIQQYIDTKNAYTGELIWPLKEVYGVGSCFGFRGVITIPNGKRASVNHPGIDIGADFDTPVIAAASGKIVAPLLKETWGIVTIDHGNGLKTSYTHLNKINVNLGDPVDQGQQIGTVGGRSDDPKPHIYHPEWGPYNNYDPHLHFSVMSSNVDPNANYNGIKAVVLGSDGNRYVNPVCFINSEQLAKITFTTDRLACNSICYQPGSSQCTLNNIPPNMCQDMSTVKCTCSGDTLYSKTSCSKDSSSVDNAPFKFCDIYKGITTKTVPCAKSDNAKWEISNVKLSSTNLKSDQTLKIIMTLKNDGDVCVNVKQKIGFITLDDSLDITFSGEGGDVNVYKATSSQPEVTSELTCTFTSDQEFREKEEKAGKCVLWYSNDKPIKYSISTITAIAYGTDTKEYSGKELTFTVTKGADFSSTPALSVSNVQLTPGEQAKIDKTKERLKELKLKEYIDKVTLDNQVPPEIIYGMITVESGGDINADSGLAKGIMQIRESTYNDNSFKFEGKCSWEEYLKNKECQILAGIMYLKKMHDMVGTKTLYYQCNVNCYGDSLQNGKTVKGYWSTCTNGCSSKCIGPVIKQYTDWEAALRLYNGGGSFKAPTAGDQTSGCENQPDYEYVEKIMKYVSSWKTNTMNTVIAKDEANKGILGTYTITPTFNTKLEFDIRLFGILQKFANRTVLECGKEDQDKNACIKKSVTDFNTALPDEYKKDKSVTLGMACDDNPKTVTISKFIEEINNCVSSIDTDCQCAITSSEEEFLEAISTKDYTTFKYTTGEETTEIYLDHNITFDGKLLSDKKTLTNDVHISEMPMYKDKGDLIIGNNTELKKCIPVKNTYRFCLKTNYKYTKYNSLDKKTETKPVVIPFALLIRDQTPPAPIKGISANNMEHAKDNVILKWNKSDEKDVIRYELFLTNEKEMFQKNTVNIKQSVSIISLSNDKKDYVEYKDIQLNPTCTLKTVDSTDYCSFEYTAIDNLDKEIKIELKPNILYYLSNSKQFMYIINNTNTRNVFTSGTESFIGIVAGDIDGNEISNDDGESYVLNANLINITPEDNLEAGFTKIIKKDVDTNSKTLTISWNPVTKYIDGTEIIDTSNIEYLLYMFSSSACPTDTYPVSQNDRLPDKSTQSELSIDISNRVQGDYCIGISANKTKEYPFIFLSSTTIPELP